MKKFLALVLALVMTMSLVTISAGAEDFTDADKVTYSEAVDVMTAIGVVGGYADGSFNPTAGLTRGAAAKIICNMLLGPTTAEALVANEAPFSDVAADNVFAGYIAYCVNEGIISGYADGTFKPAAPLTGYAFMKMLLGALGYDADIEGYVGSNWSIAVAKRALNIGLDDGLVSDFSGAKALTREEAALYAFNTLKATMVEYKNKSSIVVGDITVTTSAEATKRVDGNVNGLDALKDNSTLEFAEEFFSKLSYEASTPDTYSRPAHTWNYGKTEVGVYSSEPVAVFTQATEAKDVAAALKGYLLVDKNGTASTADDVEYKINNTTKYVSPTTLTDTAIIKTTSYAGASSDFTFATISANQTVAARLAEITRNGRLVEVYANSDNQVTEIVCVGYAVAKVDKVTENKSGDVSYRLENVGTMVDFADEDKDDELVLKGEVAKDDIVTYCYDGTTYTVYPTEKFEGTQTKFNALKDTITVDGALYTVGTFYYDKNLAATVDVTGAANQFPNSEDAANYYVDQFGLVVKSDAIASETKYAVVNKIATIAGLTDAVQAELIFADGKTEVVTVKKLVNEAGSEVTLNQTNVPTDSTDLANVAFSGVVYTYDVAKDGKYELTAVPTATKSAAKESITSAPITEKGNPVVNLTTDITVNNNTVFVVKTTVDGDPVYTAYTGFKAVPAVTADSTAVTVDYAKNTAGAVEFVYIDASAANASVVGTADKGDIVYITSLKKTTENISGEYVYYYDAIINGEAGVLATDDVVDSASNALAVALYKVTTVDEDGVATTLVKQNAGSMTGNDDYKAFTTLTSSTDAKDGVVTINTVTYTYDGTETVYVIDADGNVEEGTVGGLDLATNAADYAAVYVKEVDNSTTAKEVDVMYIVLA